MAKTKKLTPEQEKEIKLLQANNDMLENTKKEAQLRGNEESVKRIEIAQEEVIDHIRAIDPNAELSFSKSVKKDDLGVIIDEDDVTEKIAKAKPKKKAVKTEIKSNAEQESETEIESRPSFNIFEGMENNDDVQYDVISLPSNGEGYPTKVDRLPVAYLTAADENIITSPNLYKDGLVIDCLLERKILNKTINIDDLYSGDADAIILFLRATSYGADFPIQVFDTQSKQMINTIADLTSFKPKEFVLKGDKDGYFDYTLPISKDEIKFRFLTRKDEKNLQMLSKLENDASKATLLESVSKTLTFALKGDTTLDFDDKKLINDAISTIDAWSENVKGNAGTPIAKMITNRLEMNIVSINGNNDRKFIHKYVNNMLAKDALELRRYILKNEPGIDWEMTVERPENLGGGSFKTFLEWDDSIFLNITEG